MLRYIDRNDQQEWDQFTFDVLSAHHEQNHALEMIVADPSLSPTEKIYRLRWALAYALDMIDWLEFDARHGYLRDTRPDHQTLLRYLRGERVGIYVGEEEPSTNQ